MKNSFFLTASMLSLSVSLGATHSYADHFRKTILLARAPVVAAVTPSPLAGPAMDSRVPVSASMPSVEQLLAEAASVIENSTQKNHAGLAEVGARVDAGVAKQIAMWKSQGFSAPLENDEELSRSVLDFTQKLSALNFADETTWSTAQADTLASLHHLQGVYADYRQQSASK